jgi:hypothetical protein
MSVSNPSLFIEVPAPIQERDWSCICFVIGHVYVLPLSTIFDWIDIRNKDMTHGKADGNLGHD